MKKWEYICVFVSGTKVKVKDGEYERQEFLNMLGNDGYELVTAVHSETSTGDHLLYFKRSLA